MPGDLWTPDQKLTTAPTFTTCKVGGLDLPVMDDVPPEQVHPIPPEHVTSAIAVFGTQLQALLREIVELRSRVEFLEIAPAPEPARVFVRIPREYEDE